MLKNLFFFFFGGLLCSLIILYCSLWQPPESWTEKPFLYKFCHFPFSKQILLFGHLHTLMKETPWATCLFAIVCSICMESQKLNSFPTDLAFSWAKCWFLLLQPLATLKITRSTHWLYEHYLKFPSTQGNLIYKDWSSLSHCHFPWSYNVY